MLTEFKFVGHLRKILKTLNYFLVKFEMIPEIEVSFQKNRKIWEKLRNSKKKKFVRVENIFRKFYKYVKSGESLENLWNFKINFKKVWKQKVNALEL